MYKKRKTVNKKKILIIAFFVITLITGIIVNVVNTERELTIFEKAIKDSVLMVEKILSYPIEAISKKISENKEKNQMYDEYKKLKDENQKIDILTTENEELKKQIQELQNILNIDNILSDCTFLNATVINRDIGNWNDTIIIDKGENSGISINMPVVVGNGLIGKVIKTTNFTSTVRLLKANNSNDKISVKIKNGEEYIYGILNGYDSKKNTYIIEGISQNVEIKIGSLVTTTGMGDIFPSGIVIGEIIGASTDNFDLANILEMKSGVDFDNLSYVTILKRNINK